MLIWKARFGCQWRLLRTPPQWNHVTKVESVGIWLRSWRASSIIVQFWVFYNLSFQGSRLLSLFLDDFSAFTSSNFGFLRFIHWFGELWSFCLHRGFGFIHGRWRWCQELPISPKAGSNSKEASTIAVSSQEAYRQTEQDSRHGYWFEDNKPHGTPSLQAYHEENRRLWSRFIQASRSRLSSRSYLRRFHHQRSLSLYFSNFKLCIHFGFTNFIKSWQNISQCSSHIACFLLFDFTLSLFCL